MRSYETQISGEQNTIKSPAGFFRKKIENINVYAFSLLCKFLRSNSKLSHLDQESEKVEINLSKKINISAK